MKKYLLLLFPLVLLLSACSKKIPDPYASFRNKSSETIYQKGEKDLASGKYDSAAKQFEALDAVYPFGPHAEQAQLDIIYAYYMAGDDASALTAADRYMRLFPRATHVDYAYYMRGVVGFNVGLSWLQRKFNMNPATRDVSNLQQSFMAFSNLVHLFPQSEYTADSYVRMSYIRNLIADRELDIANFYIERSAYVAAANRGSYIVEHFQGTPAVVKALAVMVKSYRELGLTAMADSTLKILGTNYPYSSEYRSLQKV